MPLLHVTQFISSVLKFALYFNDICSPCSLIYLWALLVSFLCGSVFFLESSLASTHLSLQMFPEWPEVSSVFQPPPVQRWIPMLSLHLSSFPSVLVYASSFWLSQGQLGLGMFTIEVLIFSIKLVSSLVDTILAHDLALHICHPREDPQSLPFISQYDQLPCLYNLTSYHCLFCPHLR